MSRKEPLSTDCLKCNGTGSQGFLGPFQCSECEGSGQQNEKASSPEETSETETEETFFTEELYDDIYEAMYDPDTPVFFWCDDDDY